MSCTLLIAINAIGWLLSGLLLVSGFLWYLFFALVLATLGAAIVVLVLGFWFGGYGRVPGALALAVGNAAVLIGFAGYMISVGLIANSGAYVPASYVEALLIVFGYAVLAGTVTRPVFRARSRSA